MTGKNWFVRVEPVVPPVISENKTQMRQFIMGTACVLRWAQRVCYGGRSECVTVGTVCALQWAQCV